MEFVAKTGLDQLQAIAVMTNTTIQDTVDTAGKPTRQSVSLHLFSCEAGQPASACEQAYRSGDWPKAREVGL